MATMHQQKEKTSGIDISNMLNDVNKVLHNHLTNILTPMLQEKQNIQKILLNMPMVKQLQDEHLKAHQAVYAIQAESKALKLFYEGELTSKNEQIHTLQAELVKTKEELLSALKQTEKLKNVTLEVKEIEKPQTPPINITNDSIKKNEKVVEGSVKIADMSNLNSFMQLASDSEEEDEDDDSPDLETDKEEEDEDDEEDEDEDEDDEDEEGEEEEEDAVVKTILLAQKAGEYATIDTASEEDEEDEDKEEEDDEEDEDDEGMEVEDIEIDGESYVTTSQENGTIYKVDEDGELVEDEKGDYVKAGYFKDGISFIL